MITEPKITLLAATTLAHNPFDEDGPDEQAISGGVFDLLPPMEGVESISGSDYLAEFAGRACYQSWNRPNPKTASTDDYVDNILNVKHYSVLSHASATFYIEGVSRSLTLELIRSRFLAFSQLSQRYVDSSDLDWVVPPIILTLPDSQMIAVQERMDANFKSCVEDYEHLAQTLEEQMRTLSPSGTMVRKRAREAARAVLPNDTETKIVCTGNMRAWRDFIAQRWTVHADLEIQRLALHLLVQLREIAPATFADFDPIAPAN
jgi:thymidylate synthase (FAD)